MRGNPRLDGPKEPGSGLPRLYQAGRLRRAKPSPTRLSARSVKMPGFGTFPTDACTLALMAVGKSSKLFTGSTQGLEVMRFGGAELTAQRVPQPAQGPLTGENTRSRRRLALKLPMASAVSASMPAFSAFTAAVMAMEVLFCTPSVAMLIMEFRVRVKFPDPVIKPVMALIPRLVAVPPPVYTCC